MCGRAHVIIWAISKSFVGIATKGTVWQSADAQGQAQKEAFEITTLHSIPGQLQSRTLARLLGNCMQLQTRYSGQT